MKETDPPLKRRARRLGAKIFLLDEAGFQSDPPLSRTYGLTGQTPVVVTSGPRQSLNGISAINARGEFWAATDTGKWKAAAFVMLLKNFIPGRAGKIFLVLDGPPAHKANWVQRYVDRVRGRWELGPLPT